jgi:hypothetical protein
MRPIILSDRLRGELDRLVALTPLAKERCRAQALLWLDEGRSAEEVADLRAAEVKLFESAHPAQVSQARISDTRMVVIFAQAELAQPSEALEMDQTRSADAGVAEIK